jgi:hypothetical protein
MLARRADRAGEPLTSSLFGDEKSVSPRSSSDQRRAIRAMLSMGIDETGSAGSKSKIRLRK